jgi:hypothetical protein
MPERMKWIREDKKTPTISARMPGIDAHQLVASHASAITSSQIINR